MKRRLLPNLLVILLITSIFACSRPIEDDNGGSSSSVSDTTEVKPDLETIKLSDKIGKAVFYLENSGSVFGYVNGFTEYVQVISDLAYLNIFSDEGTSREFNFVNGGEELHITHIGDSPSNLKNNLNVKGFSAGYPSKSNLNEMFKLALDRATNDTVAILVSDGVYDLGKNESPLNQLVVEGNETKEKFITRLNDGDVQTIVLKLNSDFNGSYFPALGGSVKLNQKRPYYIWIFGRSTLLNKYFGDEELRRLNGFSDLAKFFKLGEYKSEYEITTYNKIGRFKIPHENNRKLEDVELNRGDNTFGFTFAVDYSSLPCSSTYLLDKDNYEFNNQVFNISEIVEYSDQFKIYDDFTPTHLISIESKGSYPYGEVELNLINRTPSWIADTSVDSEDGIKGDEKHTFGFKFLMDAISDAYLYKNEVSTIETFKFIIEK